MDLYLQHRGKKKLKYQQLKQPAKKETLAEAIYCTLIGIALASLPSLWLYIATLPEAGQ